MTLPPVMYGEQKIRWLIDLDSEGQLLGKFVSQGGDTKDTKRGKPTIVPHIGRTVGVKPKLLADSAEYVLGIGGTGSVRCGFKSLSTSAKQRIEC